MKRPILTGWGNGNELARSGLVEIVISFHFQFAWGPLPSAEELSAYFVSYKTDLGPGDQRSAVALRPCSDQAVRLRP